ncbi:MAG: extracellular solute-binding protein [Desulfobacterales bacterium]|nr:extracellular solute-binding protein [Desulfobacterales bacterium]
MKKKLIFCWLAGLFIFSVAVNGWSAPNEKQKEIIAAAQKEGALDLVWGSGTIAGSEGAKRLGAGFNKYYGLDLKVNFTPGPSMPSIAAKIMQEYAAGRPSIVDVYLGSEGHFIGLLGAKALDPLDWSGVFGIPSAMVLPEGIGIEVATRIPGVAYNSSLISSKEIPRATAGYLEPKWKGRLASTPYAANFDRLSAPKIWGLEKTVDYVTRLSHQISGLIRCSELQRLVSGEFHALVMSCGDYEVRKFQAQGAPLDHVFLSDAALVTYWNMGVPKNAKHPNAAKLFVNYMVSREGQDIMYDVEHTDHLSLPGSKSARFVIEAGLELDKLHDTGVRFLIGEGKRLAKVRAQLQAILKKGSSK